MIGSTRNLEWKGFKLFNNKFYVSHLIVRILFKKRTLIEGSGVCVGCDWYTITNKLEY